jgi:hypothetical protein
MIPQWEGIGKMNKTYRAIRAQYHWPNMKQEIEAYVKHCKSCQVNKVLTPRRKVPMEITTKAEHRFEKCYMDVVGPLPITQGNNRCILTLQDDLSKYVAAIPIHQQEAQTIAKAFVERIVLIYGTPRILQTDQGANFVNEVFKATCRILRKKRFNQPRFTLNHRAELNEVIAFFGISQTLCRRGPD